MKKFLIILLVLFLGFGSYLALRPTKEAKYVSKKVTKQALSVKVEAIGEVYAKNQVDVGSQVSGQVTKIYVKLGQFVKKGQKIAQIDKDKQQNNYDITNARLQAAKISQESISIAYDIALSQYERQQGLYKRMASSKTQLEEKQTIFYKIKAELKDAKAKVAELEISLKNAIKDLAYTRINAPMDGYIVNIAVEQGQIVNAVQNIPTIARLANLSVMEIRMQIAEADINKIKKGQKVFFSILSDPAKKFKAKVAQIDLANTQLSDAKSGSYNSNASSNAVYYYARSFVRNKDNFLRIGMSVQNEIIIKSLKDILAVPTTAIKKDQKGFYVVLLKNKKEEKSYVSLGSSDALNTQILSGVKLGDEVLIAKFR